MKTPPKVGSKVWMVRKDDQIPGILCRVTVRAVVNGYVYPSGNTWPPVPVDYCFRTEREAVAETIRHIDKLLTELKRIRQKLLNPGRKTIRRRLRAPRRR